MPQPELYLMLSEEPGGWLVAKLSFQHLLILPVEKALIWFKREGAGAMYALAEHL
jgi:hypothetical protein